MQFIFESPLILEETAPEFVMVEATLLTEGVSEKGYLYTVDDADFGLVAETAVNKSVYYGQTIFGEHKAPRLKGQRLKDHSGMFSNKPPVGKVVRSWFDKKLRKVKAKLKIWDKDLVKRIKRGFKVSIRGIFNTFQNVIHRGREAIKVIGLKIKDIQLVEPDVEVGVKGAKIEHILEETMSFSFPFSPLELEAIGVVTHLFEDGEL